MGLIERDRNRDIPLGIFIISVLDSGQEKPLNFQHGHSTLQPSLCIAQELAISM